MRRNGGRIDQGVCTTSHASQCRTVDQVVVLPDGADAKGWYVGLSRAREAMHVYTRDKAALHQSVMYSGERKSVLEIVQVLRRSTLQSRDRTMPNLWAARQAEIVHGMGMNAKAFVIKLRLSKHSMSRLHTMDCLPIGVGSRLRTASTIRLLPSTRKVFSRGSTASRNWGGYIGCPRLYSLVQR
jgi:hypothetical protein